MYIIVVADSLGGSTINSKYIGPFNTWDDAWDWLIKAKLKGRGYYEIKQLEKGE